MMTITFLGTGTSHGIPTVGCSCPVCTSENLKNKRMRSSLWIRSADSSLLIDTSPEFRLQALREGMKRLDAVLFTHAHADHSHGLDDIRPLCREKPIPVYGNASTLEEIRQRFSYIFRKTQIGGGKPRIELHTVNEGKFRIGALEIAPVPIMHGDLVILGYRIGDIAYLTDCSRIPEQSYALLADLRILILGALRYRPHETHFSIEQASREVEKIAPQKAYFTHFCHDIDHDRLSSELPSNIRPAFDGLSIEA